MRSRLQAAYQSEYSSHRHSSRYLWHTSFPRPRITFLLVSVLSLAHIISYLRAALTEPGLDPRTDLSSLESHYAPGFAAQHTEFNKSVSQSLSTASQRYASASAKASEGLHNARRQIQEQTGLKVGDLQPAAESQVASIKEQAQETISRIQAETQDLGNKVHEGVEGLKEQVEGALSDSKKKAEAPEEPPKRLV